MKKPTPPRTVRFIQRALRMTHASQQAIATRAGVSQPTVGRFQKAAGIQRRPKSTQPAEPRAPVVQKPAKVQKERASSKRRGYRVRVDADVSKARLIAHNLEIVQGRKFQNEPGIFGGALKVLRFYAVVRALPTLRKVLEHTTDPKKRRGLEETIAFLEKIQ